MSKADFQLFYDGPALRYGTMDVNELASSLLATGDLLREANHLFNAERAEVSIRVRSDFKKGSFEVSLVLDQSLLEQAKNLLLPVGGSAIGAAALFKILFGTEVGKKGVSGVIENVLDLWKKLKGERPKGVIEDRARNITIVVSGDGNEISVDSKAAALYEKDTIRSSIIGVVRPVTKRGVKSLEIRKKKKTINQVQKSDLPPTLDEVASASEISSANVRRDTRETVLRVVRANFEKGKWGFSDGAANFSADITDQAFKQKLDAREIGFFKGDTLRVMLKITQVISPEGQTFQTTYEIERVIQHIHAPKQQHLLPPGE